MINAREEFEAELKDAYTLGSDDEPETFQVQCAWVCFLEDRRFKTGNRISLREGYTDEEYEDFLKKIDRVYDNGYGTQMLDGVIWLTNGDWVIRGEYDGKEWWEHQSRPEIPAELRSLVIKSH